MITYKLNNRQHRFALNILAGQDPKQAYENAGYSIHPSNLAVTPYQLLAHPSVASFIEDKRRLKEQIILANEINDTTLLSQTEKRQILADIARASLVDHLDAAGDIQLNLAKAKVLKEYYKRTHIDRDGNPVVTKSVKLIDPISAIQEDNKMMGHYAPSKHLVAQKVELEITHVRKLRADETAKGEENREQ